MGHFKTINGRVVYLDGDGLDLNRGNHISVKEIYDRFRDAYRSIGDLTRSVQCPVCGADVYYVQHNGGKVFFDDLGWPWPKHPCTDKGSNDTLWSDLKKSYHYQIRFVDYLRVYKSVKQYAESRGDYSCSFKIRSKLLHSCFSEISHFELKVSNYIDSLTEEGCTEFNDFLKNNSIDSVVFDALQHLSKIEEQGIHGYNMEVGQVYCSLIESYIICRELRNDAIRKELT